MKFKWLTVPWSNETKSVKTVQLWEVRWDSKHGYEGVPDSRPEMEAFTSEAEAKEFRDSLQYAYRLLRYTTGTRVSMNKGASV